MTCSSPEMLFLNLKSFLLLFLLPGKFSPFLI